MYSTHVTEKMLDAFEHKNGWRPVRKSVQEVKEFCDYIDSIVDIEANSVNRSFSWAKGKEPNEKRRSWIARNIINEQFLCFADAAYFATRYGKLRSGDERIIDFQFRKSQEVFQSILAEFDDLQVAIQLFILKARQLGVSTVVALYFLHRILFRSNTYAVMASVAAQQSEKLGKMIDTTWTRLPFWLPPGKKILKEKEPVWWNGSMLSIQSGNQEVGIAQGHSPSCIHISEVGDYTSPRKTLEEGLFPACHPYSSLFFVIEGTGSNNKSTWQKEKYEFYKAEWGKGGRFRTIFIPPACAPDLYPLPDWLKSRPIPEIWNPTEDTLRMRARAELFVRSTDYLSKAMGSNWKMGREYMWYWECMYREAVASHSSKVFLQQYACTDFEAFQSANDLVFNDETIDIVTTQRNARYTAYAVTGKTIIMGMDNKPYMPPDEEIDWDGERIPLVWQSQTDEIVYEWELIPLKPFDDSDDTRCFDKLLIWEDPMDNAAYSMGIDTADGLNMPNEDRSTLNVHRNQYGRERDAHVAAFTSLRCNSAQMARIAAAVAVFFSTDWNGEITTKSPLGMRFITEQVRKTGDECQLQLKIMGFLDHHVMHFYDDKGNIDPNKGGKEGWRTTKWSRAYLLSKFVDAVTNGWFKPECPILIRQLSTFVRKEKNGISEMGHEIGQHDDNIFSNAMAHLTAHDLEGTAARLQQKFKPIEERIMAVDDRWATIQIQI